MKPFYDRNGITIYCGDNKDVVPHLGIDFDALITDPPYGIDFDTDYTRFQGGVSDKRNRSKKVANDVRPFDPVPWLNYRRVILWGANNYSNRLPPGAWLIWDKRNDGRSKDVMSDAEAAWFNNGHGVYIFSHAWDGFVRASEKNTNFHPTQKPAALMSWCIEKAGARGPILDPFMGSGPTLIAAQFLGIPIVGIEISEEYCRVAVDRLRQLSFWSIGTSKPAPKERQFTVAEMIERGLEQ